MKLHVSNYHALPIYEQIRTQIQELIFNGELGNDEQLPSIRVLAAELNVGIITVKRAYEDLEKDDLIYNRQGKGCFVKPLNLEIMRKKQLEEMRKQTYSLCEEARRYGIKYEELMEFIMDWRNSQ